MVNLSVEHVLLFVVVVFLLYHLLGNCGCTKRVVDGFSSQQQYYDPIKYTDGDRVFYGCKGAFDAQGSYIPCPPGAIGTRKKPPINPKNNPLNTYKCLHKNIFESDECKNLKSE